MKKVFFKKIIYIVLTAALSLFCAYAVFADDTTKSDADMKTAGITADKPVLVLGIDRILAKGVPGARDGAVLNSMINAVHMKAITLMPEKTYISSFARLNELLYKDPGRYVESFRVVSENASGDTYRVISEVLVSSSKLQNALVDASIIMPIKDLPSILFLVSEKKINDLTAKYWWDMENVWFKSDVEATLSNLMSEKGFIIKDHFSNALKIGSPTDNVMILGPDPSLDDVIQLGRTLEADIIIMGKSETETTGNVMEGGAKTYRAYTELKAVIVKSGEIIGPFQDTTVAVKNDQASGQSEALKNVAMKLSDPISAKIVEAWQKETDKPKSIDITVKGARYLAYFVTFRNALRNNSDITNVQTVGMKPDEAQLVVTCKKDTESLAKALLLNTFDNFSINIMEALPERLVIEIVPGPPKTN